MRSILRWWNRNSDGGHAKRGLLVSEKPSTGTSRTGNGLKKSGTSLIETITKRSTEERLQSIENFDHWREVDWSDVRWSNTVRRSGDEVFSYDHKAS